MQYNSTLTSLHRLWTLTLKGKGMSHLKDLIYPHAKGFGPGFSCMGTCVLMYLSDFDSCPAPLLWQGVSDAQRQPYKQTEPERIVRFHPDWTVAFRQQHHHHYKRNTLLSVSPTVDASLENGGGRNRGELTFKSGNYLVIKELWSWKLAFREKWEVTFLVLQQRPWDWHFSLLTLPTELEQTQLLCNVSRCLLKDCFLFPLLLGNAKDLQSW